ncbi:MAG TPA: amino acid adenylation domain-containing protein, partial [Casimicrobiaceae bacterium]|nr:amino acid adenylation domain-containing protein [Casimicrobiaceae bacterium]
ELDAARFRPDPAQPGSRCYATGDLGRQTTDGALLHLGRRDQQFKVRGVRIEAAEVEGVLRAHPDVRDAAVAGQQSGATPGETRLVACVAAREWRPDLAADLARFVRERLPDPMVPDGWSFVAALPVTTAGKVDRRALPEPPPRRERRFEPGVCQRFMRVAATDPQAIAFRDAGAALTYADLERQSAQLARRLVAAGIGDGDVVALLLPRTPLYAVALIAVLRAGGACMPLDPRGPRERNAAMLRTSRARALVASTPPTFDVDGDIARIDPAGGDEPNADAHALVARPYDPDRFAFLLYTSGSTGIPKGVEVREGQVLHRLRWDWDARPFAPGEVACARGTVGFVDTISEWLGPLLAGVTTEIIPDPLLLYPRDMIAALAAARVSRILLVPSQLELLLDAAPELGSELPVLRLWTASGEPLSPVTVDRFRRAVPEGTLWNVYGATEAWDATCQCIGPVDAVTPIGTPLPGIRAYVLDKAMAPVPVGVAGELYLAGDGLALGYRDDDALTRERFVDNPFCPGSGDRLYRTGDRARRRDNGLLEWLGRADRRVKINGIRVELSEVETVLALHRDVREAAVVAANGHIVGYVVARDARGIDGAHLREFLRGRLLAAAMPREVIELPTLPRNARGKVERSALTLSSRPIEAPRRELERTLMQVFADLLGRHRIGPSDDFFDCGGDSLLGVRLVGEIEALTGLPFRLDTLAVAATPRAIADALDQSWSAWATQACITINASGQAAPLFGLGGAWGHAVRLLRLGRALGADIPFHAMQPPQMRWPPGIELRAMAAHYAAQIRTLAPHGPCRLIGT